MQPNGLFLLAANVSAQTISEEVAMERARSFFCVMQQSPRRGARRSEQIDVQHLQLLLSADYEGVTYDWDLMLDVYEKGEYTQAQADAVAQLMLHCGVAGTEVKGPNGNTIFLPSYSFPDVPFWFTR